MQKHLEEMVQQSFPSVFGNRDEGGKFIGGMGSGGSTYPHNHKHTTLRHSFTKPREDPSDFGNFYLVHPERVKDMHRKLEGIKSSRY